VAKFLIVSALGEASGVGIRLRAEGHEVLFYIHESQEKDVMDGFLEKVDDWRKHVEEADLVFFDDCDQKHPGESAYKSSAWSMEVREKYPGKLVIGGGHPDVARLENDRTFANDVMQQMGIETVPMERFTDFNSARKFLQENGGAWAMKHNSQVDRDAAHVSKDPEDMLDWIEYLEKNWKELGNNQPVDFVLQQTVDGIEFAVTAFYDGQRFRNEATYLNQEEKKLMDGGLGPNTGQTAEIGYVAQNSRLFQTVLKPMEPFLADKQYVGFLDVNCIVNAEHAIPLEFTARPGYPTLYSWCNLLAEPVGTWMLRMAQADPAPIQMKNAVNCTLVLASGSFPNQHPTRNKLIVVHGLDKVGLQNVWLCEVRWVDGEVMGAGDMGYLAVITQDGPSIPEAVRKAYSTIEQISVTPYEIYRMDIGQRALREFNYLWQWGWLD